MERPGEAWRWRTHQGLVHMWWLCITGRQTAGLERGSFYACETTSLEFRVLQALESESELL